MKYSDIDKVLTSIRSGQLIGNQLIDLFNNSEIIKQIHEEAKNEIRRKIFSNRNRINSEIIILSLSLIAYQNYTGNFWNYVENTYGSLFDVHPSRARTVISDVLNSHSFKNYTNRNIDVAIMFTIVPLNFLPDFFDFLFDIYKTNFAYSLKYLNLEREFNFIYNGLSSIMLFGKDSDVSIDVTGKTYQLIKATQRIIQNKEFYKEFIEYSIKHLKLIDQIYHDIRNNVAINYDEYPNLYHQAIVSLVNIITKKDDKMEIDTHQVFSDDYLFDLSNHHIYLRVPNFRVDYLDGDVFELCVFVDGKIIWSKEHIKIRYIFGGYKTVVDERIQLVNPFGDFVIELRKNKIPIQNLTIEFKRDYYVFDSQGKEIYRSKYGNGSFIIADRKIVDDSVKSETFINFEIGSLNVIDYKAFKLSNGQIIEFGTKPQNGFIGNEYDQVIVQNGNQIYPLFKDAYAFYFTSEFPDSKLKFVFNGQEYELRDISDIEKQNNLFTYRIRLDDLNVSFKPNNLSIKNIESNSILVRTMLFIDKTFKVIEEENQIQLETDQNILELTENHKITLMPQDTYINVSFIHNAQRYTYKIALPNYKIQFENYNLNKYEKNKNYWYKDFGSANRLFVYGVNLDTVSIKNEYGETLTKLKNKYSDFINEIDITALRNYTANDYVYIDSENDFSIKIYFKPQLYNKHDFINYDYDKGSVNFFPEGIGLDSLNIDIFYQDDLVATGPLNSNITYNFKPFKSYKYDLYTKKFLNKEIIKTGYIQPYKYSMFVGFSYPITKLLHELPIGSIDYELKEIYTSKKFILFKEYLGKGTFKGRILVSNHKFIRELPFDVSIEIEGKIKFISTKLYVLHFEDEELLSLNENESDIYTGDYEFFDYNRLPQIDYFIMNIKGGKKHD